MNGSINASTTNIEFALHNSGGGNVIYVAVINPVAGDSGQLAGMFWSTNQGTNWTAMDLPRTTETVNGMPTTVGIHAGGHGG